MRDPTKLSARLFPALAVVSSLLVLEGCAEGLSGPTLIAPDNTPDLISQGKPVTSNTRSYDRDIGWFSYGETFPVDNVVDGHGGDTAKPEGGWSFWLAGQDISDTAVTIDLGDNFKLSRVILQDTHNRHYHDRGAKDFVIESATSAAGPFQKIAEDSFTKDEWENLILKSISLGGYGKPVVARYVRVHVLNGWGDNGVGLNEIMVFGTLAPGGRTGG
jgi:hypothetical protein